LQRNDFVPKTYSQKMSRRSIALVAITLGTAFVAKAAMREWGGDDGGWLAFGLTFFTFSLVFLLGGNFWRSFDDMQRQGQAISWYWGSIAGIALAACLIAATGKAQSEFMTGVGTLVILQLICSLLLHIFWWFKGRGYSFRSSE
jgi:hypothetical protein